MFGLEGSGFTISIGVTLLLVGLVVFYVKQRMDEWDNKLQGMLNLNKALAASHAALEQRVMAGTYSTNNDVPVTDNIAASSSPFDGSNVNNVLADDRQVVSDDSSSSDSDSDSDSDESDSVDENEETKHMVIGSELNNNNNESSSDGIKVVELESGGDNKQINLNEESLEEISLNTSTNDEVGDELDGADDEDEDEDEDDEDDEDSDDETEATELSTEDISNNVAELLNVKKVATEVTAELDFKKLNVGKLRELVVTRSLADKAGAKKMKKKQLVELLS